MRNDPKASDPGLDELDTLLDAALASYVDAEPTPDLKPRILAATRDLDRRRATRWLPWAVPALAALLPITIFLAHRGLTSHTVLQTATSQPAPRSPAPGAVQGSIQPPPAVQFRHTRSTLSRPSRSNPTAAKQLPRQEVFPAPAALSPEEQAIVTAVNRNPGRVAKEVAQPALRSDEQLIEPLHIAAIHIPPLNPPDNGSN